MASSVSETSIQQITRALQKLIKDSPRKATDLKKNAQEALDEIKKLESENASQEENENAILDQNGVPTSPTEVDRIANKLIIPIKLACESRNTKLMITAIDLCQKLLTFHYFRGEAIDEENPPNRLIVKVINTISSCFDYPDDAVQLQTIKACFTAVTEPICDIHEGLLMKAISTIYYIYLLTRNQVNQNTAKGTLTQMLHNIFQRMELRMSPDVVIGIGVEEHFDEEALDSNAHHLEFPSNRPRNPISGVIASLRGSNNNNPKKTVEKGHQVEKIETPEDMVKSILNDVIKTVVELKEKNNSESNTQHHLFTDCYIIFRALCKLSMKEVPKELSNDMNSIDMKSKILSLDLLRLILEDSGPVFRSFDKFINTAIKKHLVNSILENASSSNPTVFGLSLSIFLALVSYFKDYLKNEIGVFYSKFFLVILESPNSGFQQKWTVLKAFLTICKNSQALVDIFVNYDCGLEVENVYERMVNDLSKIAQGRHGGEFSPHEQKLRALGLECLATIVKSLVDWSKDLRVEKQVDEAAREKEMNEKRTSNDFVKSPTFDKEKESPDFHSQKQKKHSLAQGIKKFNLSAKKGMRWLIEAKHVVSDPKEVANFLRNTEDLDKTKIGEYLGESDEFNVEVLHAYIDTFNFAGQHIDIALRKMLANFRLPGEAQKIDRMMEKFAERYYKDNPDTFFVNADSVYLLSFAIIMLATDLHSPSIKDKMTKQQWHNTLKPRKGSDSQDFPDQFLDEIYDRIAANRLALQDEEEDKFRSDDLSDPKQRQSRFQREMERSIMSSKKLIKEKSKDRSVYYRAKQIQHVRPMFEIAWAPMLAAFSVLLENSDEPEVISLCLEGFKNAIRISCTFYMETERDTFVTSLAGFTFLNNLQMMKQKNIESIKALIEIANSEGNYLQGSWLQVLRCISFLEQLHLVGSGARYQALPSSESSTPQRKSIGHRRRPSNVQQFSNFEDSNASFIVKQIEAVSIDKIFSNSIHLNSNAIEHFVRCLCKVSIDEIYNSSNPRMFSLQKLVELAHFNMDRIKLVWARIWSLLSDHFEKVGCDEDVNIAMYAVDALKQLALKLLSKGELANYHFQKEFLKPFEVIVKKNTSAKIRDMVIRCLVLMTQSQTQNIRSGWKSIFCIFTIAATDHEEGIVSLGSNTVETILLEHFNLIVPAFFVDIVNSLVAYGKNHLFIDISLRAIDNLTTCAKRLANGDVIELEKGPNNTIIFNSDNKKHVEFWFPILTGLMRIVSHSHVDVRTSALTTLFKILTSFGTHFDKPFWSLIFRGVLLPIFDNVDRGEFEVLEEDDEWLTTTCLGAFTSLVNLFSHFFSDINFLLNDILELLSKSILQDNESLARIGAGCLLQLVMTNGSKFNEEMWDAVTTKFRYILESNLPRELIRSIEHSDDICLKIESEEFIQASVERIQKKEVMHVVETEETQDESSSSQFQSVQQEKRVTNVRSIRSKLTVQLVLIETLNEISFTHHERLSIQQLQTFLDALETCYNFANSVNENPLLKNKLANTALPNLLLRQEISSISSFFRILFRMFSEREKEDIIKAAEDKLVSQCKEILDMFINKSIMKSTKALSHQESKRINSFSQIIVQILKGILNFYDNQFMKHLPFFYPSLSELILSDSKEVRQEVRNLSIRIGKLKNITST